MRFAAMIFALAMPTVGMASTPSESKRIAVVVALNRPSAEIDLVVGAHEEAASLIEVLSSKAGYSDVRALIGPVASASAVLETARSAMNDAGPDGLVLFVYVGHGAGGDFGEPALLTHGANVVDPLGTGVDVSELASILRPQHAGQHVLVIIDAAQLGSIDGVALIGPTASDWPQRSISDLTVITPNVASLGVSKKTILSTLTAGLSGSADSNADHRVTLTELFRMMGAEQSDESGSLMDTAGIVNSDRLVGSWVPAPTQAAAPDDENEHGLSTVLMATGGAVGAAGLLMYAMKRGKCEGQAGDLRCGNDAEYGRYQRSQIALSTIGGGLVVAGLGMRFVPTKNAMAIQVGGSF